MSETLARNELLLADIFVEVNDARIALFESLNNLPEQSEVRKAAIEIGIDNFTVNSLNKHLPH